MKSDVIAEKIDFENMVGSELLEYISFKDEFPNEAELAFCVFHDRYQRDILEKSEIQCSKFEYNEAIAFLAATCTFDKVWKNAHTFSMKKANTKNVDKAILLWMYKILYTQILLFKNSDTCAQPTKEEDLSLIDNLDDLVNVYAPENLEKQKELKENYSYLEKVLQGLSLKHKIIYFTYLAYKPEKEGLFKKVCQFLFSGFCSTLPEDRRSKGNVLQSYKFIDVSHNVLQNSPPIPVVLQSRQMPYVSSFSHCA